MDVVLEGFDTYLFDYLYATIVPAKSQHSIFNNSSQWDTTLQHDLNGPSYTFKPASSYLSFTPSKYAYLSGLARDDPLRQFTTLFLITWLFGIFIYFVCATLSYVFVFDKTAVNHPKFVKNQITLEIQQSLRAFPVMALCTAPLFWLEVRGYSKIYDASSDGPGRWYDILQFPFFIFFTDLFIYYIHRGLHHPRIYKHLHKAHHKWIMPTPFASHAFHPLDGFAQSIPYHVFPFVFPLQKFAYIFLFVFINIWTVIIHDGEYVADSPIINGAACHTMHHLYFNYNYGQFTTLWDRLGGSYRKPNDELFKRELKYNQAEWNRQVKEMEVVQKEVEGEDDRVYEDHSDGKKVQ